MRTVTVVFAFWLLATLVNPAAGQSTFGTILGTVTDSSGAVVPNAKVTITNQGENISREYSGDSTGNYEALNLKAGVYSVAAEAPGFKKFVQKDLVLDARQTVRVNIVLEVGTVSEQVTIESTASVVNTDTQTIAASFHTRSIMELPMNFRASGNTSPLRAFAYLPGVQSDDGFRLSVQGGLPHQAETSLDGISTVSVRSNGPLTDLFPVVDGIAEMKVQGVGNNAEFGQVGDITTTSRGGTNSYHGSLFEYMQNAALDAKSFGAATKPQKTVNDFGGSIGGPVFRNRTFFFGTFEGMRFPRTIPFQLTVPTGAMRTGDFSREVAIRDPLNNNQPYAGNRIPSSQISSIATKVLEFYPQANFGDTTVQRSSNWRDNKAGPLKSNQFDIRMDHMITGKQSAFVRYSWKNSNQTSPNSFVLPADDQYNDSRTMTVSHNYTISPRILNEFRIGYANNDFARAYRFDGKSIVSGYGLQGLPAPPFNGLTSFNFQRGTSSFGKGKPAFTFSKNFQFNNNLTWSKGRHTLKFGADFRRLRAVSEVNFVGSDDLGNFTFDGRYSGHELADFMLGLPHLSQVAITGIDTDGLSWHYSFYAQDSFKLNQKLTLEYGMRWEYHPPFADAAFNITNFDRALEFPRTGRVIIPSDPKSAKLTAPSFLQSINACPAPAFQGIPCTPFLTAKEAGFREQLRFPDKRNFNPRIGFAYRPFNNNKTVVRGGLGIYTMTILGTVFYSLTAVHGSDVRDFNNSITNGVPAFRLPRASTAGTGVTSVPFGLAYFGTAAAPNFQDPYSIQWSLTVERELMANLGLRLSYVGLRSVHLPWAPDLNQPLPSTVPYAQRPLTDRPYPYWQRIYSRDTGGNGIYGEFQTELQRRTRGGLTFSTAWTWAKNLSDAAGPTSTGFSTENGGGRVTNSLDRRSDRGNVGPTRRHRWITTAMYELPFGKGKTWMSGANPVVEAIAGGWRLSGILLAQTGPWLSPQFTGGDPSGTNGPVRGGQRPDAVGSGLLANPTADVWFDREAFICPGRSPGAADRFNCNVTPIARFGNAGFGILRGPGTLNFNFGFGKDFRLREGWTLKFEGSFLNLPNHPNLADPNTNITNIAFGRITGVRGADSGGNRSGLFGLRLEF